MPLHGGETSSTTVLENVVDWVVIELRDPSSVATVVATDVVPAMVDGTLQRPATFQAPAGNYYVSVDNRNHLGVTTADVVPLSASTAPLVDFTSLSTAVFSGPAGSVAPETFIFGSTTVRQLWMGDALHDAAINQLDLDFVIAQANIGQEGYYQGDVNDDGFTDGVDYHDATRSTEAGAISYLPANSKVGPPACVAAHLPVVSG